MNYDQASLKHPVMLHCSRIPYQNLLDEVTSNQRLQAVLAGQSGTYGLPPAQGIGPDYAHGYELLLDRCILP